MITLFDRGSKNKQQGFTIVEVLVMVVVMAIIAGVVIPRLGKSALFDKFTVYTTAHQITSELRLARRLAVTTGVDHLFYCWKTGSSRDYNQYAIYKEDGYSWSVVGQAKYIPDEIVVKGSQYVIFEPSGTADDESFRYEIGSYKYRAKVEENTGRVVLEEY